MCLPSKNKLIFKKMLTTKVNTHNSGTHMRSFKYCFNKIKNNFQQSNNNAFSRLKFLNLKHGVFSYHIVSVAFRTLYSTMNA